MTYSLTSQKIRLSTARLDSLKSLQFDSMSDLILMSWMDFFATLSCQREKRNCPMLQVIENLRSSVELNSRVRIWAGVSVGIRFLRPAKRTAPASWLSLQSNMACCRVSMAGPESLHLVQVGVWFGRILDTLSPVGRIWCRSLNRKVVRLGPNMLCLAKVQVCSHWLEGKACSIRRGLRVWTPEMSASIVNSSIRNL